MSLSEMGPLGSSSHDQRLYSQPSLLTSLGITYRMMFREEWRQTVDFAKKRHVLLFPVLLAMFSMLITLGFPFLVGEGVPDSLSLRFIPRAYLSVSISRMIEHPTEIMNIQWDDRSSQSNMQLLLKTIHQVLAMCRVGVGNTNAQPIN